MKTGKIEFILSNVGSKSEKMQPFLREADGNLVEVFKESDNPFKNDGLKPYEGKKVNVTGEANEYGVFIIDTIDIIEEDTAAIEVTDTTKAPEAIAVTEMAAKEIIEEKQVESTEVTETEEKAAVEVIEEKSDETEAPSEPPLKGFKKFLAFFHRK